MRAIVGAVVLVIGEERPGLLQEALLEAHPCEAIGVQLGQEPLTLLPPCRPARVSLCVSVCGMGAPVL